MKLAFFKAIMTSRFFEAQQSSTNSQSPVSTKILQESGNKWAKLGNFKLNVSLIHVFQNLEKNNSRRLAKIVFLLMKIPISTLAQLIYISIREKLTT